MKVLSLNKDAEKFNYGDLTRFEFNGKVIDIHNLFEVLKIYTDKSCLYIELESNEYYKALYGVNEEEENKIFCLAFVNYCLDNSFDTEFRTDLYSNISSMSFSQPNEICEKSLSIDLLFDNNDFFKIACDDCYFEMKSKS